MGRRVVVGRGRGWGMGCRRPRPQVWRDGVVLWLYRVDRPFLQGDNTQMHTLHV